MARWVSCFEELSACGAGDWSRAGSAGEKSGIWVKSISAVVAAGAVWWPVAATVAPIRGDLEGRGRQGSRRMLRLGPGEGGGGRAAGDMV